MLKHLMVEFNYEELCLEIDISKNELTMRKILPHKLQVKSNCSD